MRLADAILMEMDQEAQTTKRVLERVPGDKLTWKPHAKSFSLGQLALHIASVPASVTAAAVPDTFEAPGFSQAEPRNRQEVLDTFSQSIASAKETLAKMDDGKMGEVILNKFKGMSDEPIVIKNLKYWGAPRNDGFVMMPNEVEAYRAGDKAFEFKGSNGFMITFDINSKDVAAATKSGT